MKRWMDSFILVVLAATLAGCGSSQRKPWGTLKDCEQENTTLSMQVQTLESENTQLTEQVNTLSTLDAAARLEALDTLDKARIGKHTRFYDKDDNGTNEILIVYLELLDTAQDFVKAVGRANIELWDLEEAADAAKLAEWSLQPSQLHPTWGGTIFSGYYRIKLPLEIALDPKKDYTVKTAFTDYLSGKVLTDQKVITVKK